MDAKTRRYQQLCRRAESLGYPGDVVDLLIEDDERERDQRQAQREARKAS